MNESSTDTVKKPSALKNACFLLAIILLNWLCFRSALKGYFLADDFVHVDYLFHVFQGNWPSLLNNFWGNWMQAEGTTFYRPLISITLALDYLFQGARAEIFHLSNLIYQTAASLLLYLCGKEIVRALGESEKKYWDLLPLAAAMLFSVYPLHCEVVNWIIARVDSVALTFSLASFYLWCRLLNGNFHKRTALLSLFSLALALMSKEMAITVPPTLTLLTFLKTDGNFKNKLACACKQTAPLWYLLIFYLGWRSFVLGTIAGGYQGSVGAGLSGSLIKRWFLDGSQLRVLFPFNVDIFGAKHSLAGQLKICYALIIVNYLLSLRFAPLRQGLLKGPLFCLGWYIISLLPTYQVWNLTANLQGSRFVYFATAPLLLGMAWLLFPSPVGRVITILRSLVLIWLTILYAGITSGDNQAWSHAMEEVRAFKQQVEACTANLGPGEKISLLNIPQSYRGAHMLYNAATMSVLLNKPLCRRQGEPPADHTITFEPATFGDSDLIAVGRLRRLAERTPILLWDRQQMRLLPLSLHPGHSAPVQLGDNLRLEPNLALASPPLSLNPLDFDYIDIRYQRPAQSPGPDQVLILQALGSRGRRFEMSMPLKEASNLPGCARFQVSEHKQWLALEEVQQISLTLLGARALSVDTIQAASLQNQQPLLRADQKDLVEDNDGICRVRGPRPTFSFDASGVTGASKVLIEFSRPNSWFEHYTGTMRNTTVSPEAGLSDTVNKARGSNLPLQFAGLKGHGFFQMRALALDDKDQPLGYFSDPLNFQL